MPLESMKDRFARSTTTALPLRGELVERLGHRVGVRHVELAHECDDLGLAVRAPRNRERFRFDVDLPFGDASARRRSKSYALGLVVPPRREV